MKNLTIYKTNKGLFKFVVTDLHFKSENSSGEIYNTNEDKLSNNIIRSKSTCKDICLNNDFYYFVTLTINSNYDRYDIDYIEKAFSEIVRYLRKKYNGDFFYVNVPEKHKDGAFHLHCFFSKDFEKDFYYNYYGFLSFRSFDKFGFSNIQKIDNFEAMSNYILKYINKDMFSREKGKRLFYCSQGLKRSEKIHQFIITDVNSVPIEFYNEYCSFSYLNYYNYITTIDNLYNYNNIINIV